MTGGREISRERARAWSLAAQGLTGDGFADVDTATRAVGGVYSSAPACYLTYAARIPRFRLADLDRALFTERSLARLRCFHGMVYIVPREQTGWIVAATETPAHAASVLRYGGLTRDEYERHAADVEAVTAGRDPVTVAEIRRLLEERDGTPPDVLRNVIALMGIECRVVRATVRGSWTSDAYAYARWEDWFGAPLERAGAAGSRALLARHYVAALGPATLADLKWWAGWTLRDTRAAVEAAGDGLAEVTLTGEGLPDTPAYAAAGQVDRISRADPAAAEGVLLLPYWDPYTMGYHRDARHRIVPDADRPRVYDKAGNGTSMLLVDGVAAGVWDFDQDGDALTVRVAPFSRAVARARRAGIEAAAERLAAVLGSSALTVEHAPPPGALADGPRNTFMAPVRLARGG